MQNGKIILGIVSILVTAGGALGFKTLNNKFGSGTQLFGTAKFVGITYCYRVTCWTNSNGLSPGNCHWDTALHHFVGSLLYTQQTISQHHCKNVYWGFYTHTR